ncbi:hypothetical protein POTOM_054564 [Populus tomentosa]|uniref:Uncharacterized protein n=1 Tax=Populus tomentosa TaxID=118781 RepID=A0A8X7XZG2_POPTO|nr:hypothetical protein POTOM_054564 [Populus tomentosa]
MPVASSEGSLTVNPEMVVAKGLFLGFVSKRSFDEEATCKEHHYGSHIEPPLGSSGLLFLLSANGVDFFFLAGSTMVARAFCFFYQKTGRQSLVLECWVVMVPVGSLNMNTIRW